MDTMNNRQLAWSFLLFTFSACGGDGGLQDPGTPTTITLLGGSGQSAAPGTEVPQPLLVKVTDANGREVPGVSVAWSVLSGGGTVSPATSSTDQSGVAATRLTLGPEEGDQTVQAEASGLNGSPVIFTETATVGLGTVVLSVASGGNNVPERFSSDLWVHGNYAYTGTWLGIGRPEPGDVLKVWSLDASGAPSLANTVTVPNVGTVSDVQVSEDGRFLVLSGEDGGELGEGGGIYIYNLANPARPALVGDAPVPFGGVHTVTLSTIGGQLYAFAAKNPGFSGSEVDNEPALLIYRLSNPASPALVSREPVLPHYGIHDTFVRDGLAFVFIWDEGFIIYDVGNGIRGGSPSAPVEVSRLRTSARGAQSPSAHNGWWFHNPTTGEERYLFVGQEGRGVIGSRASGDIHVVDVSDLTRPVEVAFFHLEGAGAHNFWVDEARQVLYAAFYNGGVVALDISGTLSGDLSQRLLSQAQPGGPGNTYTWGVQLANGSLYAIDMLSGLWQLRTQ
jgi:hypothetical protein